MMKKWIDVLSGVSSGHVIAAIHYAIRLVRHRADLRERDYNLLELGVASEPSRFEKELAEQVIAAIEADEGIPIHAMARASADRHVVELATYAQKAVGASTETTKRANETLNKIRFTTNIRGSTIGAVAIGDHARATGTVNYGTSATPLSQEQHKVAISDAQMALVHDQDALERIDDRLYEALGQFLTLARKIQVEQQSLVEVQAQMKATLDEVWAQQEAKGMKPKLLPKGLEVVEALAKSPITAEIAKKLWGA